MKKSILKDALILVAITLVAALCLAVVYEVTKDTIANAEETERMDSFRSVFPEAQQFREIPVEIIESYQVDATGANIGNAFCVLDGDDNIIGVVLSVVSHKGYGGDIVLSLGVGTDGKITGMKVTAMSETSGLGANSQNETWASQFKGLTGPGIGYVKDGEPGENEITSATVTTKAVLEAVNCGCDFAGFYFDQIEAKEAAS